MPLYTRGGDSGRTGLADGSPIGKEHPRIEACGSVDELNSTIGLAVAACTSPELGEGMQKVQRELFSVGAALAVAGGGHFAESLDVRRLEQWIDEAETKVQSLRQFILPGGSELAARLHVARAVCRRAERRVAALARAETVPPTTLAYLNRLSDLLFAWARLANRLAGVEDVPWARERQGGNSELPARPATD